MKTVVALQTCAGNAITHHLHTATKPHDDGLQRFVPHERCQSQRSYACMVWQHAIWSMNCGNIVLLGHLQRDCFVDFIGHEQYSSARAKLLMPNGEPFSGGIVS